MFVCLWQEGADSAIICGRGQIFVVGSRLSLEGDAFDVDEMEMLPVVSRKGMLLVTGGRGLSLPQAVGIALFCC